MLHWLACFAFNWFQRDLCLQLNINIRCGRNSANTLSVEFVAKSFFPISPEIKETDSRRRMYFGDPRRRGLPTVGFDGAAIESTAVKQTLTESNRLDTRPKYPKRCKEKYQNNLFRLSFNPDLANLWRINKDWLDTLKAAICNYAKCFFWSTGRAMHLGRSEHGPLVVFHFSSLKSCFVSPVFNLSIIVDHLFLHCKLLL